jgi:NAD(P)H-hydrate repair Nnr-like enzyme with NAD(P)H-hydrate epimerase domain
MSGGRGIAAAAAVSAAFLFCSGAALGGRTTPMLTLERAKLAAIKAMIAHDPSIHAIRATCKRSSRMKVLCGVGAYHHGFDAYVCASILVARQPQRIRAAVRVYRVGTGPVCRP